VIDGEDCMDQARLRRIERSVSRRSRRIVSEWPWKAHGGGACAEASLERSMAHSVPQCSGFGFTRARGAAPAHEPPQGSRVRRSAPLPQRVLAGLHRAALLALLLLPACADPGGERASPIRQAPGCTVTLRADVPATIVRNTIAIDAEALSVTLRLQVDTGDSQAGSLSRDSIRRLGVLPAASERRVVTVAGGLTRVEHVDLPDFRIGALPPMAARMAVMPRDVTFAGGLTVDGQVGAEILARFDIEIDPAAGRMRLFDVEGCGDSLVPFTAPYEALPLRLGPRGLLLVPMRIDGKELLAILDTGSNAGVLVLPNAAMRLGLADDRSGDLAVGRLTDWAGQTAEVRVRRVDTLEIGSLVARGAVVGIVVAAPGGPRSIEVADALLGSAFLLRQRIWISYATAKLYVARGPARGAE
jgi:predicted aspartyl protease